MSKNVAKTSDLTPRDGRLDGHQVGRQSFYRFADDLKLADDGVLCLEVPPEGKAVESLAREVVPAPRLNVTLSIRCFEVFLSSESILFVDAGFVVNETKRSSLSRRANFSPIM